MTTSIKISQLQTVTEPAQSDTFMVVQNGSNKKLTLQTLLSKLNSPVEFNTELIDMDFIINGSNVANLLVTDASSNRVGIKTAVPQSTFQVIGDVRSGGTLVTNRSIFSFTIGAAGSGGAGQTLITATVDESEEPITGIFITDDVVNIVGSTVANLNGDHSINVTGSYEFTYTVADADVTPDTIDYGNNSVATKSENKPGVFAHSRETIAHNSSSGSLQITSSFGITGLNINGSSAFTIVNTGTENQEKMIYLKTSANVEDKATFDNVNGLGFNRIQLNAVGDSVSLIYEGTYWVVTGLNGATISTI